MLLLLQHIYGEFSSRILLVFNPSKPVIYVIIFLNNFFFFFFCVFSTDLLKSQVAYYRCLIWFVEIDQYHMYLRTVMKLTQWLICVLNIVYFDSKKNVIHIYEALRGFGDTNIIHICTFLSTYNCTISIIYRPLNSIIFYLPCHKIVILVV